jgi:DNA-binding response OmpR family regulator
MVGATGFMTKPIEPKKVLAVVRKYLKLAQNPDFQKQEKTAES